jgi:hypothetical protein
MRFTTNPRFDLAYNPFARFDEDFDDNLLLAPQHHQPGVRNSPVQHPIDCRDVFDVVQLDDPSASKKPRKRKYDNSVGLSIAAVKDIEEIRLVLDIDADVENILLILSCIKDLRKLIRKLRSSNGNLTDARIVINPNDDDLIDEIRDKQRKSKIEQIFLDILDSHGYEIVDQAKDVIRDALGRGMTPAWIE